MPSPSLPVALAPKEPAALSEVRFIPRNLFQLQPAKGRLETTIVVNTQMSSYAEGTANAYSRIHTVNDRRRERLSERTEDAE